MDGAELMARKYKIIPAGTRSGMLTTTGTFTYNAETGRYKWHCVCDCGGTTSLRTDHFEEGRARSCGCQKWLRKNARKLPPFERPDIKGVIWDGRVTWDTYRLKYLDDALAAGASHADIGRALGITGNAVSVKLRELAGVLPKARRAATRATWPPGIYFEDHPDANKDRGGKAPTRQHNYSLVGNCASMCAA
jgi:hypothetical protein